MYKIIIPEYMKSQKTKSQIEGDLNKKICKILAKRKRSRAR